MKINFLSIVGNIIYIAYLRSMDAIKLLKKKRHVLNIRQIESEVGMPATTLSVYLTKGYLPDKWIPKIEAWVDKNLK